RQVGTLSLLGGLTGAGVGLGGPTLGLLTGATLGLELVLQRLDALFRLDSLRRVLGRLFCGLLHLDLGLDFGRSRRFRLRKDDFDLFGGVAHQYTMSGLGMRPRIWSPLTTRHCTPLTFCDQPSETRKKTQSPSPMSSGQRYD